jgi:hypothetical protein
MPLPSQRRSAARRTQDPEEVGPRLVHRRRVLAIPRLQFVKVRSGCAISEAIGHSAQRHRRRRRRRRSGGGEAARVLLLLLRACCCAREGARGAERRGGAGGARQCGGGAQRRRRAQQRRPARPTRAQRAGGAPRGGPPHGGEAARCAQRAREGGAQQVAILCVVARPTQRELKREGLAWLRHKSRRAAGPRPQQRSAQRVRVCACSRRARRRLPGAPRARTVVGQGSGLASRQNGVCVCRLPAPRTRVPPPRRPHTTQERAPFAAVGVARAAGGAQRRVFHEAPRALGHCSSAASPGVAAAAPCAPAAPPLLVAARCRLRAPRGRAPVTR